MEYNYDEYDDDELTHHGIKGMKWGIRRTKEQLGYKTSKKKPSSKDDSKPGIGKSIAGSVKDYKAKRAASVAVKKKAAAAKKAEDDAKRAERKEAKKVESDARKEVKKAEHEVQKAETAEQKRINAIMKKPLNELTNEELVERINRMTMEKTALDLQRQISSMTPKQVSKGKAFMNSLGKDVLAPAAKQVGKQLLIDYSMKLGKEYLGLNEKKTKTAYQKLKEETDYLELKKKKGEMLDAIERREKKHEEASRKENSQKSNNSNDNSSSNSSQKQTSSAKNQSSTQNQSTQSNVRKPSRDEEPIEAEWWYEVPVDNFRNDPYTLSGQRYIRGLLEEPKKK